MSKHASMPLLRLCGLLERLKGFMSMRRKPCNFVPIYNGHVLKADSSSPSMAVVVDRSESRGGTIGFGRGVEVVRFTSYS